MQAIGTRPDIPFTQMTHVGNGRFTWSGPVEKDPTQGACPIPSSSPTLMSHRSEFEVFLGRYNFFGPAILIGRRDLIYHLKVIRAFESPRKCRLSLLLYLSKALACVLYPGTALYILITWEPWLYKGQILSSNNLNTVQIRQLY